MKKPLVSVVILNWNGKEMTAACIKSLDKLKFKDFEIVVVDNGSGDGSADYISKKFPKIRLVKNKRNLGFAGGNNSALDFAKGKYICLLNNDMVVDPLWLTRLLSVMEKDKKIGAAGGGRFDWNDENPIYNKKNILRTIKHLNRYTGFPYEENYHERLEDVDSLSGGAVLLNRQVIDKIGFFDTRFFAYTEDRDLFARMKRAGYKTIYVPKAYIWHQISRTGRRNKYRFNFLLLRNHLYFLFKNFDPYYLQLAVILYIFREAKASVREIVVNARDPELERARRDVARWFLKNFKRLMKIRATSRKQLPKARYNHLIGKKNEK